MKKIMTLLLVGLAAGTLLTGCGKKESAGLRIVAAGPYVDDSKAGEYGKSVLIGEEKAELSTMLLSGSTVSSDSDDVNAKSADLAVSANLMKLTAMIAGKEVDVMICDIDAAARFVNDEVFLPLNELFTEEELAEIDESLQIVYEAKDDDGNPTGEMLDACGIVVSDREDLKAFLPSENIGVYVIGNTTNLDTAKQYVMSLMGE